MTNNNAELVLVPREVLERALAMFGNPKKLEHKNGTTTATFVFAGGQWSDLMKDLSSALSAAPSAPVVSEDLTAAAKQVAFDAMLDIANEWHRQLGIDEVLKTKLVSKRADTLATEAIYRRLTEFIAKHAPVVSGEEELRKALRSASAMCGNVIYNTEQQPISNHEHCGNWRAVKGYIDDALARNAHPTSQKGRSRT